VVVSDRLETWDALFVELARTYARKSKDESTRVGAVIVGPDHDQRAGGFNGLPRGVVDDPVRFPWSASRHRRPEKYSWYEHAERNAIYNAARAGVATGGCTMYVAGGPPCADCARAVIQAGIVEVVAESLEAGPRTEAPFPLLDWIPGTRCPQCDRVENTSIHICSRPAPPPGAIDWRASVEFGMAMLREAKVAVRLARKEKS
jgi:dCMP deaminase